MVLPNEHFIRRCPFHSLRMWFSYSTYKLKLQFNYLFLLQCCKHQMLYSGKLRWTNRVADWAHFLPSTIQIIFCGILCSPPWNTKFIGRSSPWWFCEFTWDWLFVAQSLRPHNDTIMLCFRPFGHDLYPLWLIIVQLTTEECLEYPNREQVARRHRIMMLDLCFISTSPVLNFLL